MTYDQQSGSSGKFGSQNDKYQQKKSQKLARFQRGAQAAAIFASITAGVSIGFGMYSFLKDAGGVYAWVITIALAAIVTVIAAYAWHMLIDMAAREKTGRPERLALIIAGAVALTVVLVVVAAQFHAVALGGSIAQRFHKEQYLGQLTAHLANVEADYARAQQVVAKGEMGRERIAQLVACEKGDGCLSGKAGLGPVTKFLQTLSRQIATAVEAAAKLAGLQRTRLDRARSNIETARQAARVADENAFADVVADVRADILRGQVTPNLDGIAGKLIASPYEALYELGQELAQDDTLQLESTLGSMPGFEALSDYEAVNRYPEKVVLAQVVGVAVEILPLLMFGLVLLSAQLRLPPRDHDNPPDDWDYWADGYIPVGPAPDNDETVPPDRSRPTYPIAAE